MPEQQKFETTYLLQSPVCAAGAEGGSPANDEGRISRDGSGSYRRLGHLRQRQRGQHPWRRGICPDLFENAVVMPLAFEMGSDNATDQQFRERVDGSMP